MTQKKIQCCLDAGRLGEAAALLEADRQFDRALDLYEQLWDFTAAARCALEIKDLPRALNASLQQRDPLLVEKVLQQVLQADRSILLYCAATATQRGDGSIAARLYLAASAHEQAAQCMEKQGILFMAAQQYERCGQPQKALELYQQHVSNRQLLASPMEPGQDPPEFFLGRLLLRYGREEEALPWLQHSWTPSAGNSPAGRAIVAALARLGLDHGARFILELLGKDAENKPTLKQCLEDPALNPLESDHAPDRRLAGRYQIGKLLGSGGMGRVHLGVDLLTKKEVAIKVFTAPGGLNARDAYLRFLQEARTTGQLHHPHIVSLLDFNEGMRFMVLEYMMGGTLADRLSTGLDQASCRSILLQVLSGLEAAHQRGIVHRDIKPSNIFFTHGGAAKLGDFGVAHLQDTSHTQTGAFIGTLAFMSPEQITGGQISFATDFYALGVMLFLMATGELPFQPPDLINQHLYTPPPKPSSLAMNLPIQYDEVVVRCMAKNPQDRYESLDALRQAVERFPGGDHVSVARKTSRSTDSAPRRRATDQRYTEISTLFNLPEVQVRTVQDNQLGRSVILVRFPPGSHRQRAMAILSTAASAGGEHLQRVLNLDQEMGQAILEQQLGNIIKLPEQTMDALVTAGQLGQALTPLHREGLAHGNITQDSIKSIAGITTLSLCAALVHTEVTSLLEDIAAVLKLTGLSPQKELKDSASLVNWVTQEINEYFDERRRTRRQILEHNAPPEIKKMINFIV